MGERWTITEPDSLGQMHKGMWAATEVEPHDPAPIIVTVMVYLLARAFHAHVAFPPIFFTHLKQWDCLQFFFLKKN